MRKTRDFIYRIEEDDSADWEHNISFEAKPIGELIRCKDCKHWKKTTITYEEGDPVYTCPKLTMEWGDEDGYCFMGERR